MDFQYYNGPAVHPQPYPLYGISTPDQTPHAQPFHNQLNLGHDNNYLDSLDASPFSLDPGVAALIAPEQYTPESLARSVSNSDANTNASASASGASGHMRSSTRFNDDSSSSFPERRSDSEEKELGGSVPTEGKRKEQNRAAQRAFRERKERRVRDLEDKISQLQEASVSLQTDNEQLKQQLARSNTENEVLRFTTRANLDNNRNNDNNNNHNPQSSTSASSNGANPEDDQPIPGPMRFSPRHFYSHVAPEGGPNPPHRVDVDEKTGERLLSAGATWDYIQAHELSQRGLVDVGDVSARLKGSAQCNGQGPAFREGAVERAIVESVGEGEEWI